MELGDWSLVYGDDLTKRVWVSDTYSCSNKRLNMVGALDAKYNPKT